MGTGRFRRGRLLTEPSFDLRRLAVPAYGPSLLYGLGEGAILPVVPLLARDLGASLSTAAAVVTLMYVGSLLFNVPASLVVERFGERCAIVGAALCGVIACAVSAFAPTLLVLAVGVLLLGCSHSVFLLARQKYLTEAVPVAFRARALSTLGGVTRIGIFIGPFLGAGAIALVDLRAAYAVCGLAFLGAAVLAATLEDLVVDRGGRDAAPVTVRQVLREHRRVFLTVGVGILLVAAVRIARQAVIPLWADEIGLSAQTASLIYGLAGALDMLVFYPAGRIMDLRGRRWVTVPSMLVMGGALLVLPVTTSAASFAVVAAVLGLGNGIGSGMVMTLGADFSPAVGRGPFLGVWRVLSDLGAVGGPAVLSGVTAMWSLGAGAAVTGGIGLVAAAVLWSVGSAAPKVKKP